MRVLAWSTLLLVLSACRPPAKTHPALEGEPKVHREGDTGVLTEESRSDLTSPEISPGEPDEPDEAAGERTPERHPAGRWELELPSFEPALVTWPQHREPLPVLVVAHGAGGRAEQHEQAWRSLVSEKVAILAFRGRRLRKSDAQGGYYYPNHHALNAELEALVNAALENAALAEHLAPFPWTYAGYSQGATMGALALVDQGHWFSRFIFIEGGTEGWTVERARRLSSASGDVLRVAWVCGTESCRKGAEQAKSIVRRADVSARVFLAPGGGHTYLGTVGTQVEAAWAWLYSSEAAW